MTGWLVGWCAELVGVDFGDSGIVDEYCDAGEADDAGDVEDCDADVAAIVVAPKHYCDATVYDNDDDD